MDYAGINYDADCERCGSERRWCGACPTCDASACCWGEPGTADCNGET